jgi:2'-5' RNA ligase
MYYSMGFYPELTVELAEPIAAIRKKYDPTYSLVRPHVTLLFPVPDSVGESHLIAHIGTVLKDRVPFAVRPGGFKKSRDHWLFLTLTEGESEAKSLHEALYTGILGEYRRDDIEFVPHIGLGLFIKEGCIYDWNNPQETEFDRARYDEALAEAKELPLDVSLVVERLNLNRVPDEAIEWATGKRASIPEGAQIAEVQEFVLGSVTETTGQKEGS